MRVELTNTIGDRWTSLELELNTGSLQDIIFFEKHFLPIFQKQKKEGKEVAEGAKP